MKRREVLRAYKDFGLLSLIGSHFLDDDVYISLFQLCYILKSLWLAEKLN